MAGIECGKIDVSKLNPDDTIFNNDKVWLKGDVDEKIYIWDRDNNGQPEPYVVIKFNDACHPKLCDNELFTYEAVLWLLTALEAAKPQSVDPDNAQSVDKNTAREQKAKNFCGNITPDNITLFNSRNYSDNTSANTFRFQPAAIMPTEAVIPMKSNIKTYGPYASPNFGVSAGGTKVEVETDLAPWVFGSINAMNIAGNSMVQSSIGLIRAETGSATVPGLPTIGGLGFAIGGAGPNLSNLTFTYGSSGITTQYSFKTYTPKFGSLNRHFIDKFKDITKNRQRLIKFLRNEQIKQNKINSKINNRRIAQQQNDNQRLPRDQQSLARVFVGSIYTWPPGSDTQNSTVGTTTLDKSIGEMIYDYDKKAYMSLDAIYGPISKYGDGGLPRFATFETGCHLASTDLPQPPYAKDESPGSENNPLINGLDQYNLAINQDYTDPLTNPFGEDEHHHTGDGKGHSIDLVGRESDVPVSGLMSSFYAPDEEEKYSEDYRFLGMRGPIVLHSWGYDTQGKPIPNETDIEEDTKQGKFKSEELKDKFLGDWLGKPATWPVAPIDFRFDRKRGVWVTPPGYKVVVAVLDEKLQAYSSAIGSLINKDITNNLDFGPTLYDKDGNEVKATDEDNTEAKIKIVDRIGLSFTAGTKVYCYYDTFKCEYIILEGLRETCIRFKLIDLCQGTPVEPDYGDNWTKHAGYGDKFPNNHILGIRINCEGDPIDKKGQFVNHEDIQKIIDGDEDKQKAILLNLFDTCGRFGAAYAVYNVNGGLNAFNEWKQKAATGFGLLCDPTPDGTCILGEFETQCSTLNIEYDSYDIVFLDGYARFVECELTQKLYMTANEVSNQFPEDEFKNEYPEGNAAATLQFYYGDPGNGIEPKFYKNNQGGLQEIEFRVFDPFEGYPKHLNPFAQLDYGDKVLAVFDEDRKKYVIYQALKIDEKVIKFALIDNKDIGDRISRAVLVDLEGYPIDDSGTRLTQQNFANNFITVFDPFAIHGYSEPTPKYHNWGTTGFGPALGSENFNEHLNGITLNGGDWNPPSLPGGDTTSVWTGGPFIGYAISRKMTSGVQSEYQQYKFDNEIIFLESFAHTIAGKIASTSPSIESSYYLGALRHNSGVTGGFIDGRIPFTRDAVHERANLRVSFPIDQHAGGKYITGDFYEAYTEGDVYNNVDGCKFIAKLDHVTSKVNDGGSERLYYSIIEVDNVANRGKTVILKKELSDQLNQQEVKEKKSPSDGIDSEYLDGFMWDRTPGISSNRYEKTTIFNRTDWAGKALIMKWDNIYSKHINTSLAGYDPDGTIYYQVTHAGTIAQVGECTVPLNIAGRFGQPGAIQIKDDKKISKFSTPRFYHGLNPLDPNALNNAVDENNQPIIHVSNPWMTYDGAGVLSLWDETAAANIEDANYRVVYAREAPIIMTGKAYQDFRPENLIVTIVLTLDDGYSSCPGFNRQPVVTLLTKVENPMGYGAKTDDLVTIQRVFLQNANENNANYKYIVIGTSKPPDSCGG